MLNIVTQSIVFRQRWWRLVFTILAVVTLGQTSLQAQTGTWDPIGADLTYPRTLLKAAALDQVRASLSAPDRLAVYQGLWADAQGTPLADNTSATGRRLRATFAKNAAFLVLLNRQPDGGSLSPLTPEQRDALISTSRGLLETLNPAVEVFATWSGTTPYTEWQWRSKELIDYLIAYDLLRGAGETAASLAPSQAKIQEFAGRLYQQSTTPVLGLTFYGTVKNNYTLMTASALGLAAVVLNDAASTDPNQQPLRWAGAGLYNIDNVLWRDAQRQSDSTQVAGYAEGPYYFKYAMLNCLPFFRAMGNFLPDGTRPYTFGTKSRSIRNPYFDPKYTLLYDWITAILMPDGRFPALEDSYTDMGMPELALTGKSRYVKAMHFSKLSGTSLASLRAQLRDITVDMRAAWLAAAIAPSLQNQPALTVLPASGNLVFRSANDSLGTYLHLYGRGGLAQKNAGGHSQGEASSFILHAQGQLLALNPGYLSYARRNEVGQATNHNLVLVDGAGPAIGTPGTPSPAQSAIHNPVQTPQLAYGEVATSYQGASIVRKTLFVRNSYYLLADAVQATAAHSYTWQLHGYGLQDGTAATGLFINALANQEGTWQKNGVSLLAHVTTTGGAASYTTATNLHETTYNTAENHTTLLVQQDGTTQTQFLAALYPYTTQPLAIATTSQPTTAALAATGAGFIDIAFAQADSVLSQDASGQLPEAVSADGQLNFYSANADGTFAQLFLQEGTALRVGTTQVVRSSRRAILSWQQVNPLSYNGYASRATTLTLALKRAPVAVTGLNVSSFSYDAGQQQLRVVLAGASTFQVQLPDESAPLPVVLTDFGGRRDGGGPALLTWHTASERQNRGFEVQRHTAASPAFDVIGFVAGAGPTGGPSSYTFRDEHTPGGTVYYRLRQLDEDGGATFSPVVAVPGSTAPGAMSALQPAFPQPALHAFQVGISGADQQVELLLSDGLGKVVRRQHCRQQARVDVSTLAPGLYYLTAYDATGHRMPGSQKIVVGQ
jgi:hypothetical protein